MAQERAGRDVEKTMRYQLGLQDAMKADLEKALRQVESLQTTRRQYLEQITVLISFRESHPLILTFRMKRKRDERPWNPTSNNMNKT